MRLVLVVPVLLAACSGSSGSTDGGGGGAGTGGSGGGSGGGGTVAQPLKVQWQLLSDGDGGPPPRPEPNVASLGDKLVVFGGRSGTNQFLDDTWVWDGTQWSQLQPASKPSQRSNGVFVEQGSRDILYGGVGPTMPSGNLDALDDTWAFDGTDWAQLNVTGPPKRQSAGATNYQGQVVLYGGANLTVPRMNDGWALDSAGTAWTQLPMGPVARRASAMVALGSNLYLIGGSYTAADDAIKRFDGQSWSAVTDFTDVRANLAAGALMGAVVIFGGFKTGTTAVADTNAWPGGAMVVGAEPSPRSSARIISQGDHLLLYGGTDATGNPLGDLWVLRVVP